MDERQPLDELPAVAAVHELIASTVAAAMASRHAAAGGGRRALRLKLKTRAREALNRPCPSWRRGRRDRKGFMMKNSKCLWLTLAAIAALVVIIGCKSCKGRCSREA